MTDLKDRLAGSPPPVRDAIHDQRPRPKGVVPRHLQTWMMMALAAALLLIVLVSGHATPPRRATPASATAASAASAALPPERLRRYQEELADQEARLRRELADSQAAAAAGPAGGAAVEPKAVQPSDPIADERRQRQYASLFAENVAFTHRSAGASVSSPTSMPPATPTSPLAPSAPAGAPRDSQPVPFQVPLGSSVLSLARSEAPLPPPASGTPPASSSGSPLGPPASSVVLEGTVIQAVLMNRLDGSFPGPVSALVTSPVYSLDRQTVLIPEGARILGAASPVQVVGESRLAVRFHRLLLPSGDSYSLDQFTGLNQRGDAGLKDQVNRHYLQLFGTSAAIGALSGLAQYSTRSPGANDYSFTDAYGQGLGTSLASSAGRILDRFLNVLPTITIREGHRLDIYVTSDLRLPPYDPPR